MANPDGMKLTTEIHTMERVSTFGPAPTWGCSACPWAHTLSPIVRDAMDSFETHHAGTWIRFADNDRPWYRAEDGRRINWSEEKGTQTTTNAEDSTKLSCGSTNPKDARLRCTREFGHAGNHASTSVFEQGFPMGKIVFWEQYVSAEDATTAVEAAPVNHPAHYGPNSRGVECIDAIIDMNFPCGSAVKYIWRAGAKGDPIQDLRKAIKNIEFEIERLENPGEFE
jgi:hypothetical protein